MAGYSGVLTSIEGYLSTNFAACPIAYDNVPDNLSKGSASFVKVTIAYDESLAAEVSSATVKRTWGSLICEFHSKEDTGSKANLTNLDAMAALLDYTVISDIAFRSTRILEPYLIDGWFTTPALFRFYFNRV